MFLLPRFRLLIERDLEPVVQKPPCEGDSLRPHRGIDEHFGPLADRGHLHRVHSRIRDEDDAAAAPVPQSLSWHRQRDNRAVATFLTHCAERHTSDAHLRGVPLHAERILGSQPLSHFPRAQQATSRGIGTQGNCAGRDVSIDVQADSDGLASILLRNAHERHARHTGGNGNLASPQIDVLGLHDARSLVRFHSHRVLEAPLGDRLGVVASGVLRTRARQIHEATHHRHHNEHTHEDNDHPHAVLHELTPSRMPNQPPRASVPPTSKRST